MEIITIREKKATENGFDVEITLEGVTYETSIEHPCSPKEERLLEYYFEKHVNFPFGEDVKFKEAEELIFRYGKYLFERCIESPRGLYAEYAPLRNNLEGLQIEIVGGIDFHAWHWEAIYDPDLDSPLSIEASVVRRDTTPHPLKVDMGEFPVINLLLVTARPGGRKDVSYRTISRPLVESLQQSGLQVNVEILRPATYASLIELFKRRRNKDKKGYYHILHFDGHGGLLTYSQYENVPTVRDHVYFKSSSGRKKIPYYEGEKGFLFFESEKNGQSDAVEAEAFARLIRRQNIPIVILNACQSARQKPGTETSLARQLMTSGVQLVLAMGYVVTVSAAKILVEELYRELFNSEDLTQAITFARHELYHHKQREARYTHIELEDWMLPVTYVNRKIKLNLRDMTKEELTAWRSRRVHTPAHKPEFGFQGRDLDILEIERRLIHNNNILLIQGMGGVGKTSLLHHLGEWWQKTGWAKEVFYFGYDEKAHTLEQILHSMAKQLFGPHSTEMQVFQEPDPWVQRNLVSDALNQNNHLVILDNLESITGQKLSVGGQLNPDEQAQIHDFLKMLKKGKTKVLLGSRSAEKWLERGTFDGNIYELPGLDPQAAAKLAEEVILRSGGDKYLGEQIDPQSREKHQKHIDELLQLLGNFPLPIEIILGNLRDKSPIEILTALREGDIQISGEGESKTESVLQCVAYSHQNLSEQEQDLLLILAPFSGHFFNKGFENYFQELVKQEALKDFDFSKWPQALQQARNMGLIREGELPGYFQLQPVFPYFLRNNLLQKEGLKTGIETAFREYCFDLAMELDSLIRSKDPQEKVTGQALAAIEIENFNKAIDISLGRGMSFLRLIQCIDRLYRAMQNKQGLIAFLREVLQKIETNANPGVFGKEYYASTNWLAVSLIESEPKAAGELYEKCLSLIEGITHWDSENKQKTKAGVYHQLGMVKQKQRDYASAESNLRKALEIKIEFNDRYEQAGTYHQLGIVKSLERDYASAESNFRKALEISIEFNDRYKQAGTYHNLGNVKYLEREYASAESNYRKALEIYIEFNDRYNQGKVYHQLGMVKQKQRDYASAESNYRKALEIYIDFNDRYEQAGTYHQLGMVKQKQREYASAESNYRKALEIYIDFNDRYEQAGTYHQLGLLFQELKRFKESLENSLEALKIFLEFKDQHGTTMAIRGLKALADKWDANSVFEGIENAIGIKRKQIEELFATKDRAKK